MSFSTGSYIAWSQCLLQICKSRPCKCEHCISVCMSYCFHLPYMIFSYSPHIYLWENITALGDNKVGIAIYLHHAVNGWSCIGTTLIQQWTPLSFPRNTDQSLLSLCCCHGRSKRERIVCSDWTSRGFPVLVIWRNIHNGTCRLLKMSLLWLSLKNVTTCLMFQVTELLFLAT